MRSFHGNLGISLALIVLLGVGWSMGNPALAQSKRAHPAPLRQLLRGIDTVPTPAQLMTAADHPVDALFSVIIDPGVSLYERRRATSFLAMFDTPAAESMLTLLSTIAPDERIRWVAIYSYCRGWARRSPKHVLTFAQLMLASPNPTVREAVVFGLRFVQGRAAKGLLRRGQKTETHPRVQAVYKRVLRRQRANGSPSKAPGAVTP